MTHSENQTETCSRSSSDCFQAALTELTAHRRDLALAAPPAPVCDEATLRARDSVRLTKDLAGAPSGAEGVILGWYANEPEKVIVSLSEGGVENLPREALELIEIESVA